MENRGAVFDVQHFLNSPALFYRANRQGVGKLVPIEHLPESLGRLVDVGVLPRAEAIALLEDLGLEVPRRLR